MKKNFLLAICTLMTTLIFAQTQREVGQVRYLQQFQFDKTVKFEDMTLDDVNYIGSPYTDKNFIAGEIYHKNQLIAENVPLRYNALMDEMQFKSTFADADKDSQAIIKTPEVDIKIGNRIFVFVPYQGGVEKGGYFEVLVKDKKYDLFKKYNKKYFSEVKAVTTLTKDRPARITDNEVYYLVSENGTFYELPNKYRNFSKIFLKREKEIEKFIKDRKLDVTNERHLIEIVNYFNSLL
ncbi:MAG: hypothetical protein H0X63_08335 [Flavobacteriales bacterium]|nr:hypothetical protein [Flavobacteriales bacterium]